MVEAVGTRAGVGAAGVQLARAAAAGEPAAQVPVVSAAQEAAKEEPFRFICTATDEELLDQLDELVAHAVKGDPRAIGAISIAYGPDLLKVARDGLGEDRKRDAWEVLQRLFLAMTAMTLTFPRERGTGLEWMKRMVREGAREQS